MSWVEDKDITQEKIEKIIELAGDEGTWVCMGLNYKLFYDNSDTQEYDADKIAQDKAAGEPYNGYYNDSFEFFNSTVPKLIGIETSSVDINNDSENDPKLSGIRPDLNVPDYFTYKWWGSVILKPNDSRSVGLEETVQFSLESDDSSLLFIIPIDTQEPVSADSFLDSEHLIVNNSDTHASISKSGLKNMVTGTAYKLLLFYGNRKDSGNFSCKYRVEDTNTNEAPWIPLLTQGELLFSTKWVYDSNSPT